MNKKSSSEPLIDFSTMYRYLTLFLLQWILPFAVYGQNDAKSWDDTLNTGWPAGCAIIEISSSSDGSLQKARFYASDTKKSAPLIVSLHTWSGDYNQEDPLAEEIIKRGWNYIHPDFRGPNTRPEAGGSDLVISDIEDAINYALRNSDANPADVHIIGVSGGGFATLAAYMKIGYPVRSFNAWAAISDLEAWYDECRSRGLKYTRDLENITTGGTHFDAQEAGRRSPMFMKYPGSSRTGAYLNIYTGINDGYTGSVPVTHSINFFNKIARARYPGDRSLVVADSVILKLLGRRVDPQASYEKRLGDRNVYLSHAAPDLSLTIFEGGHEMLVPHALSLIPVLRKGIENHDNMTVLVIGDSNGTGADSWPEQLRALMPWSTVINTSVPGNTIGFDNLDRPELNTLKNAERYIDEAKKAAGENPAPFMVVIALGTNDAKDIFKDRQKEISGNLSMLLDKIGAGLPGSKIFVVTPPPVDEMKDPTGKYAGSERRIKRIVSDLKISSKAKGCELIDLNGFLDEDFANKTDDGVHLNRQSQFDVALYISGILSSGMTRDPLAVPGPSAERTTADTNVVLPPAWAFGMLYGGYTDQEGTIERIKAIQAHDYPIDAYWIDSWFWSYADSGAGPAGYLNFTGDSAGYPDRKGMWSWMEKNNIKGGFWVWDAIQKTGNEEDFNDFLGKGYFSGVYLNRNPWHNKGTTTAMFSEDKDHPGTLCGNIDFDNPKAVSYFKERLKPFFEEGADFIKLDRTDRISVCKAIYELTASEGKESRGRGMILSHSSGTDSEEYKRYPLKWTDDTRSDWTIEDPLIRFDTWVPPVALKENIAMYTNPSSRISGIPFLTNDLGGFDMGKTEKPEEELYIRWMQFSMFCPVTEVFSQPENPTSNLAWNYSLFADSLFREYSHMRMKLFPYLYSYAHLSRLKGVNMVRPIPGHLYEYLLGNEIFVAPVYEKGLKKRPVQVPAGSWINYWTGESLAGGGEHIIDAPLERIPLLVRQGAIIPERPYYPSIERGSNDTLTLNLYPGADYSFTLIEDDGVSNDYQRGKIATTEITSFLNAEGFIITVNPVQGNYDGMRAYRYWNLKIHSDRVPLSVTVNRKQVPFEYDPGTKETFVIAGNHIKSKKTEVRVFFE